MTEFATLRHKTNLTYALHRKFMRDTLNGNQTHLEDKRRRSCEVSNVNLAPQDFQLNSLTAHALNVVLSWESLIAKYLPSLDEKRKSVSQAQKKQAVKPCLHAS